MKKFFVLFFVFFVAGCLDIQPKRPPATAGVEEYSVADVATGENSNDEGVVLVTGGESSPEPASIPERRRPPQGGGIFSPVAECDPGRCNDGNACTDDACNPAAGCFYAPANCDDGDLCTADSCDPAVGCAHEPVACDDGNVCTDDACNPETGCDHGPVQQWTPCGGFFYEHWSWGDDVAQYGTCVGGACNPTSWCYHGVVMMYTGPAVYANKGIPSYIVVQAGDDVEIGYQGFFTFPNQPSTGALSNAQKWLLETTVFVPEGWNLSCADFQCVAQCSGGDYVVYAGSHPTEDGGCACEPPLPPPE